MPELVGPVTRTMRAGRASIAAGRSSLSSDDVLRMARKTADAPLLPQVVAAEAPGPRRRRRSRSPVSSYRATARRHDLAQGGQVGVGAPPALDGLQVAAAPDAARAATRCRSHPCGRSGSGRAGGAMACVSGGDRSGAAAPGAAAAAGFGAKRFVPACRAASRVTTPCFTSSEGLVEPACPATARLQHRAQLESLPRMRFATALLATMISSAGTRPLPSAHHQPLRSPRAGT